MMQSGSPAPKRSALIVAGPTTSGKSALALALARNLDGVVVNADSMQVYRELRVLTARPTPADEMEAPHRLYGVRPVAEPANVAWWREQALAAMEEAAAAGRLPILCGGTGLYLLSLTRGLSEVPVVPAWAREEARARLVALGAVGLHEVLARADPVTAAGLRPSDAQRVARAFEVLLGTGRGLVAWQQNGGIGAADWRFFAILLRPPRQELRAAASDRFDAMMRDGALEEVRALLEHRLDPNLPAMSAHGVPELAAHLSGHMELSEARSRAVAHTRQYIKRQDTWFRHHALAPADGVRHIDARISDGAQFMRSLCPEILAFLQAAR
jgi:tRNA dimethylallyltransferase